MPCREPPGIGLLRSMVAGGFDDAGGDVLGEAFSPPPDPPLHATRTATRAMSDLVTDWEEQPPIALSLYLRASAQYLDVRFVARDGQAAANSNTVKSDGSGISRCTANPARPNRARYSAAVRSRPAPVRMSISRSITLAKLGRAPSGTGISVTSTRALGAIARRMLPRIVVQRSSSQSCTIANSVYRSCPSGTAVKKSPAMNPHRSPTARAARAARARPAGRGRAEPR